MDSLDDILNRVLQKSAEKVAQRIEPTMNRRPLKDPQTNAVGFFQDISAAVRNIRSPEVAGALQAQAIGQDSLSNQGGFDDYGSSSDGASSSPADQRRTTIADDAGVIGQIANSAAQVVRQIATAGKAISEFSGSAGKLDKAVSGMAQTVVSADKDVKASKPAESLAGWLKSLIGGGAANGGASSGSGTAGSGGAGSWLESSSIADSIRGVVGRFRPSTAQMTGMNPAASGGSVPLAQPDPGSGEGFISRISQSFDKALARSSSLFQSIGRQSSPAVGGSGDNDQSWLNSSSIANSVRGFTRRAVNRLGRKALSSPALRRRFINGRRLLRGGGGGAVPGGPAGGGGGNVARGGLGWMIPAGGGGGAGGGAGAAAGGGFGGGAAGGAGGAAAGGAGGGGAAVGGAATGGGMAIAGLVLGFIGIIAISATVVSALHKLGMQGYETALRVSQFDGQLAAAKAQLDVSRMLRDVQTARSLSESGAGFMKALDKLEAAMRPITDGALDVGLRALTEIVLLLTDSLHLLTKAIVMHLRITDFLVFGAIPNNLIQRIDDAVNRPALPPNIGQRGFLDGQLADRPLRQPRAPLPPMGGGNGN